MGKTVNVSEDVWVRLMKLKLELRARSIDEVLRRLLEVWKQSKR